MRQDLLADDPKAVPIVRGKDVAEGIFERIPEEVDASTRRRIVAVVCDGVVGGHLQRREVFPFLHLQKAVKTRGHRSIDTDGRRREGGHSPDVGCDGEGEVLDVIVPMVPLPGLSLWGDTVPNEDGLVLAVAHRDRDGGVVEKEPVPLPGGRGSRDPVVPAVEEPFVDRLEVDDAKVDVSCPLAVPVADMEERVSDLSEDDGSLVVVQCMRDTQRWAVGEGEGRAVTHKMSVASLTARRLRCSGYRSLQLKSARRMTSKTWAKNMTSMSACFDDMALVGESARRGHSPVALKGWSGTSHSLGTIAIQTCSSLRVPTHVMRP